jgi:hypothetical protein
MIRFVISLCAIGCDDEARVCDLGGRSHPRAGTSKFYQALERLEREKSARRVARRSRVQIWARQEN